MRLKTLLTSLGLGAGMMYFFDPEQGNRRRALVRDKANSLVNNVDDISTHKVPHHPSGVPFLSGSNKTGRLSCVYWLAQEEAY